MSRQFTITLFIVGMLCLGVFANAQAKMLDIVCDDHWAPYEWKDKTTGELKGFAPDVVRNVLRNMGVEFKITAHSWKKAEKYVLEGKAGALFPASRKAKRETKCYYPEIQLLDSQYFFYIRKANEGKLKYNDFSDLKGHKVGVTSGYSYTPEFMEFIAANKNISEAKTDELNLKKLVKGRFDYFPGEAGNVALLARRLGIEDKIVRLPKPFIEKPYYIIFNKEHVDEVFVKNFSEALKKFKGTPEYQSIYTGYFGN